MVRHSKRRYAGPQKKENYLYPSRYGSHKSMIDEEKTRELNDDNMVVLQDEHGFYTTDVRRLDNKLADPNRHQGGRLRWNTI